MDKVKIKISKDELTIEEGENTLLGKALAGCKGTIRINTARVHREIHVVKNKEGKVFDKGDFRKPKKEKTPK